MAIAVWLGVGCAVGAAAYTFAPERLPLGLAGALVAGALGSLFGATAESLLAGSSRFGLGVGSIGGAACGALLIVTLLSLAGGTSPQRWRDVG